MGQVSFYRFKLTPLEKKFLSASRQKDTWPIPECRYGSVCICCTFGFRKINENIFDWPIIHRRKRIPIRAAAQPAISPTTVTIIHPEHASKIPKGEIFMKF